MSITTAIASIATAFGTAKKLNELSKSMQHVELRATIADLMNELADSDMNLSELKVEITQFKEEIAALKKENEALGTAKVEAKPTVKWGCYQFEGEEGLFCTACYDTKGKKHLTTRLCTKDRQCPVCKSIFGAG